MNSNLFSKLLLSRETVSINIVEFSPNWSGPSTPTNNTNTQWWCFPPRLTKTQINRIESTGRENAAGKMIFPILICDLRNFSDLLCVSSLVFIFGGFEFYFPVNAGAKCRSSSSSSTKRCRLWLCDWEYLCWLGLRRRCVKNLFASWLNRNERWRVRLLAMMGI